MRALVYLSVAIIACFLGLLILQIPLTDSPEGFEDIQKSYEKLQARLKTELRDYCELTSFVQDQMKKMYSTEPSTDIQSTTLETFKAVYTCTDELASSRASCKTILGKVTPTLKISGDFVKCSTYMNTPKWNNDKQADLAIALSKVPDDLANRVTVESQYYTQVLQKLQDGIEMAKNPPGAPPDSSSSPKKDSNGNSWSVGSEGFIGWNAASSANVVAKAPICSPAAAQAKIEQERKDALLAGSSSCTIPTLDSEIVRINAILDSSALKDSLKGMKGLLSLMLKIQQDIEAIKKKWGDDGPRKSYTKFQGGDRTAALLFSIQQVR